ncbi:MAG: tRNA (N(6)-L-threonylcarbamoyladenosine(37)-C(2))-methylthiotransferase MtaB [Alphaproteobacteria bacterium]|nr:tRNA (N(6)-L-threonylcarbamoyladenosine(37)-C(2))-methylthiotransferase MtaB [Alphaproteobacteria bacterium]
MGAADRDRSAIPRAGERERGPGAAGRRDPPARLGARRRHHPGLRHRRLRRGRGRRAPRPDRQERHRPPRRRAARDRLGRGRPRDHARAGRHQLQRTGAAVSAPEVVTFGCRLNTLESEVIRRNAEAAGQADTVVFNTCAVTNEAVRQARQAIRRTRRDRPEARIVVTGCAAQTDPAAFAAMAEVDQVLGNEEKLQPASWDFGVGRSERVRVNDIMSVRETAGHLVDGIEGRTRAFVQVQNGCDHRCTFCIIPYGRGNSRSVPMGAVVEQVKVLVGSGYREVVVTGVDITSYGGDLPGSPSLGALCAKILKAVPDLPRLRLSSIDSVEVDPQLMELITGEPRLMPHLHLSLQAGDDLVLKRMKRRHTSAQSVAFCETVRASRPDVVFGADIIAGFPTESETMFANTLRCIDEADITFLHVFPYSARPGTPAARMPQLRGDVIRERAAILRLRGEQRRDAFYARQQGRDAEVLVEKVEDGDSVGHTQHFAPIVIEGAAEGIVRARIVGRTADSLTGRLAA